MSNDSMTLWADILTNDTIVGDGPVPLVSASITRLIDGSGQFKADCALDVKGRETLVSGRQIKIWCDIEGVSRLIGEGYISKTGISNGKLAISGNDLMEELKWSNTLLGYQVNGAIVGPAISALVDDDGWTVEASGAAATATVTLPFDGETMLKALLSIAEAAGVHVRVGTNGSRILQVGDFGDNSGITLFDGITGTGGDAWSGVIADLTIEEQSDQISTRILPVGGAFSGAANITLEDSDRNGISTAQGQNGLIYYVGDEETESVYGIRWLYRNFPDIKPLAAGAPAALAAANQLYDAAYAELQRFKYLRINLKGKIYGLTTPLSPGDLVTVKYNQPIYQEDGSLWPGGAIDEAFYINRVEEYAGEGGTWQTVDLSNVNSQRTDETTDIVSSVEYSKKAR